MGEGSEETSEEFRERLQVFYEVTASYQTRVLEAASGYNQVVVLAGYAAFFTVWLTMRTDIPHWLLLATGALMAVSVIIYVTWTVINMALSAGGVRAVLAEVAKGPDGYLARVQATETKNIADVQAVQKYWKPVVWSAGVPAAIAGILLAAGAFAATVRPSTPSPCVAATAPQVQQPPDANRAVRR